MSIFLDNIENEKLARVEIERKSHDETDAEHQHHNQGKYIVFFGKVNEDA
jgi:hypothetical protein